MKMASHTPVDLFEIGIPQLSFLSCFFECRFNKPPGNSLQNEWSYLLTTVNVVESNGRRRLVGEYIVVPNLTLRVWLLTMSTASWLVRCSHRPSEAKMRNLSWRLSFSTVIDGSEPRIGLKKGSGSLNLGSRGSLLNSDLFKYASPMDLETCKRGKRLHQTNLVILCSSLTSSPQN